MAERRYTQAARHPVAQEELAANFANTHESGNKKDSLLRVDSRSAFFGYIDFTDTVDFKEKQEVPHSYLRAEENARFANTVRDDEIKKYYI